MKRLEKILAATFVIAVFFGLIVIFTPSARADTEPNNDFAHAELITPGTHMGTLSDTDLDDYYKIVVQAGQTLNVTAAPDSNLQLDLTLYNPSFTYVANDNKPQGMMVQADWTTNSAQASYSWYYVRLNNYNYGIGSYSMKVELVSQNDANSGKDAADTLGTAAQISSVSATYSGFLKDDDIYDYYKLTVAAGQTLSVNATPANTLSLYLTLYDTSATWKASDSKPAGVMVKAEWTTNSAQPTYTYYIEIYQQSGYGTYSFQVSLIPQNDANSGGDAGDTRATATQILSANATYSGLLKDEDIDDFYKLTVNAGQTLSVNVTPPNTLAIYLGLYNPSGNTVASDSKPAGLMVKAEWTTNSAQPTYTYYIEIYQQSGYGTYSFQVSLIPQNDANSGGDAGDTLDKATSIQVSTYSGFLKDDDIDDCYISIQNATQNQGIYVKVTPANTLGVRVDVYNKDKNTINYATGLAGVIVTAGAKAPSTGKFYARVHIASGYGAYTMMVSTEPTVGDPTRDPLTPTDNQPVMVSVSVTAPIKAVGNVILSYSTNGGSTWTDVTMTKNAITGLYEGTIPGRPMGTTVSYKVTGYNTVGDYFVQDSAGQYYVYIVVSEFPTPMAMLAALMILTLASGIILSKRRKQR